MHIKRRFAHMKKTALSLLLLLSPSIGNAKDAGPVSKITRAAVLTTLLAIDGKSIDETISSEQARRILKNMKPGLVIASGQGTACNLLEWGFPSKATPGDPDGKCSYSLEQGISDAVHIGTSVGAGELLESQSGKKYVMPVARFAAECVDLGASCVPALQPLFASLGLASKKSENESPQEREMRIEQVAHTLAHYTLTLASSILLTKAVDKGLVEYATRKSETNKPA